MHTSVKDSTQPSKRATKPATTRPTSTVKQPAKSQQDCQLDEVLLSMVEDSKRMETDPVYRAKIQSMTR